MKAAALALLFLLGASAPAPAWDAAGHRIACAIAWDELPPPTRAKIGTLLGTPGRDAFAESCTGLAPGRDAAALHHVFIPKAARVVEVARDCPSGCALTEIERSVAVLKGEASPSEKADAVKTLAHLVADIHQPLNIAFAQDGGGAEIRGTFQGRPVSLRDMWETELVGTLASLGGKMGRVYDFMSIEARAPKTKLATPLDWANETLWIMRSPATGYLGSPGGIDYDETYLRQNRRIALEQLDKSGVRLAALLTEVLDGP